MEAGAPVGKAVLVIEGNEVDRLGLVAILRLEGYQVAVAADTDGGLALVRGATALMWSSWTCPDAAKAAGTS
jgi:CheY-like chemotaxis protein